MYEHYSIIAGEYSVKQMDALVGTVLLKKTESNVAEKQQIFQELCTSHFPQLQLKLLTI